MLRILRERKHILTMIHAVSSGMEEYMTYLLLVIGFILLIKGADFFVDGSSSIARILKIPSVVIGLTIVAMGTSAPEAAVSIKAGLSGANEIAIANVIGSNIFNLLIVVGLCAVLHAVTTDLDILKRDMPVNIGISVLLLIFLIDLKVARYEGIILLVLFVTYLFFIVRSGLKNRVEQEEGKQFSVPISLLFIALGLAAIIVGGDMVVDSASAIAKQFGLSQNLIGLTIVAVGTSLPELATSIVATRKGESGLALGNAVGSCIFNILFILGMSTVLSPISVTGESFVDAIVLIAVTLLLFITGKTGGKTSRMEGVVCVLAYAAYMAYAIMR